jgi:hypothetical protein
MSDRETREVVTSGGHKIVLKSYLTGRETNELKAVMYAAVKMNMEDAQSGKVNVGEVPGSFLLEQEQKALGLLIVSFDGNSDNPVESVLNLPSSEYDEVVQAINKVQNPTSREKSA